MRRSGKIPLVLFLVLPALMSCSSFMSFSGKGNKYAYQYSLVSPAGSDSLVFQDNDLLAQFRFDEAALQFQLQNLSSSDMTVDWALASLGMNNEFHSVRHSGDLYGDTTELSRFLVIPSKGSMKDLVIPREHMYFDGSKWIERDLLPTRDRNDPMARQAIVRSVGRPISLILPVRFQGAERRYKFDFQVSSVDLIPWDQYVPVKRMPPPPNRHDQFLGLDQVATGIIVAGILGFSAYLLSMSKNPPAE